LHEALRIGKAVPPPQALLGTVCAVYSLSVTFVGMTPCASPNPSSESQSAMSIKLLPSCRDILAGIDLFLSWFFLVCKDGCLIEPRQAWHGNVREAV